MALLQDPLEGPFSGRPSNGLYQTSDEAFDSLPSRRGIRPPAAGIQVADAGQSSSGPGLAATDAVDPNSAAWAAVLTGSKSSASSTSAGSPDDAWARALLGRGPAPAEQGDFSRGLSVSGKQLKQTAYGTAALIGDTVGSDKLKEWGLKGYQDAEKEVQAISKESDSFTSALETGELGKWFKYSSGYLIGQVAELGAASLAGAALGSAAAPGAGTAAGAIAGAVEKGAVQTGVRSFVGKMIDKQAAKTVERMVASGVAKEAAEKVALEAATKSVYRTIGAQTANTFLNATQELGSIYGDAVEEAAKNGQEFSLGKVWLAGIAATAVDSWADSKALGQFVGGIKGKLGRAAVEGAERGKYEWVKDIATEALKGGFREGMTEGIQTAIERWGANKDLTSKEAFKDYIDSAAVGFLGGGVGGGASGTISQITRPSDTKLKDTADPHGSEILGASEKAAADLRDTLPRKLKGITQNELVDTLNNMDAVAFLYSTANPEQQKSLERAVQRADVLEQFQEAKGNKEFIERGAKLFADNPIALDDLRNAIDTFGSTRNLQRRVKLPKRSTEITEDEAQARLDEADAALNQGTSTTPPGGRPAAEPAVPDGFVRVYHSGSQGDGQGGRWVSTNREYASNYRPDLPLFFTDIPANDPRVNNPDYPDQGLKQGFTFNFELTPNEAKSLIQIGRDTQTQKSVGAPAPAGFRQASSNEREADGASFTYDVGNGARLMFEPGSGEIFVAPPGKNAQFVVRNGDNRSNAIQRADQFPDFIPENIRQPLLDYHNAVRASGSKEEKTKLGKQLVAAITGQTGAPQAETAGKGIRFSTRKVSVNRQPIAETVEPQVQTQAKPVAVEPGQQPATEYPQNPIKFSPAPEPGRLDLGGGKALNATGKLELPAEEETKVEPPEAPQANQPYLGSKDLTERGKLAADIQERAKQVDDDKVAEKVKGLLKVGRIEQADAALSDYFKKKAQPDKAELNRAKRELEFLRKAKATMKVEESGTTTDVDGKIKNVDQKIAELVENDPTDSNVKTARNLLDWEATRVMRTFLKRGQVKAAQRVFDVMDLGYKKVAETMQRSRYSLDFTEVGPEERTFRRMKDPNRKAITDAALEKLPNINRHLGTLKTEAEYIGAKLDIGGLSQEERSKLDIAWGKYFQKVDAVANTLKNQTKIDFGKSEFTEAQKKLDAKLSEVFNRFTGARLVNQGLEDLRQRIQDLDKDIAEFDKMVVEGKGGREQRFTARRNDDPMAFLFGNFDENQYAQDIGPESELGFRGDRKVTDRDLLVGERGRLTRELQSAMQDGIKGKAKRLELGMGRLKTALLRAARRADSSGSMSYQEVGEVYDKYLPYTEFLNLVSAADKLIADEKKSLMEGGMSPAQAEQEARAKYEGLTKSAKDFEEEAASPKDTATLDMFEAEKKVEQMAAGEISANEITEADIPAVMSAMARQLAETKGKPGFKDKLTSISTWIAQNMRTQSLTFQQVMDAFRANGVEMPTALLNNTHLAVHTRMLDYSKANGGGYAPREFWLRSMDQALEFNPDLRGAFTDAELLMHEEWKARQEQLATRRKNLTESQDPMQAIEGMLFAKHGLAQMRNPRLIASERERLALTNGINDLVEAWHRDLKLALELHPGLKATLTDPENGRILPTDWQAHLDWKERQRKVDERKAEMILKSQYHLYLPSLQGLTQEQMDALKLKIATADVNSLDAILHTANEMSQANRFGEGTRVDPDTGEIISLAEEARANLLDDLLLEDQSTRSLEEIYGTSDQRELNKVRRAMDEGTADVTTKEGSFGRVAAESRGAESLSDQQDLDDYEAQQQAAEDSDDLRGKTGFFSGRLTHGVVSAAVSRLTQGWKTGNQIVTLKNVSQLPDGLRERVMEKLDGREAKGLFDESTGITYLFSDMLDSDADVEFTLFHETYGHFGLRGFLGEKFDAFLENMYRIYPNVRREADALIEQGTPKLEAIDEAMADIAAKNENLPSVKAWIGRMIAGLREIGFNRVADWMSKITNAELAYYLKGAREYAKNGGYPMTNGAPGEVRLKSAQHDRLYEMFAIKDGKTTAYARLNPATQTWAVFSADKDDIRNGYSATVTFGYQDLLDFMRKKGKVEFRKRSGQYVEGKLPVDMPKLSEVTDIQGVKRWMRGMITKYQNEYRPVFDVVEHLRRFGVLSPGMDVKTALQLYERKIGAIIDDFRRIYVKPLYQLIDDAGKQGADLDTVEKFLLARHAAERNASVGKINPEMKDGSGMGTKEAGDFLREMETKPYYKTLLEIGAITDKMSREKLSYLKNTGMITVRDFKKMSEYKHYVNLSGIREGLDKFDDVNQLVGNKFNVKGKERRAMGRSGQATDIIANTILGMEAALIRGQKNVVAQKILALLETNYDPNFAVINEIAYKRQIGEDGLVMEVEDPDYIRNKDVMVAKVNGIPTTIRFKDMTPGSFGNAIFGMVYPTPPGEIMEKLGKFNQIVGQMLTTWNPAWVAINAVRDAQTLYFNAASDGRITKAQAAQMVKMLPKAIKTAYYMAMSEAGRSTNITPDLEMTKRGGLIDMYLEMKRAGGMTSFLNRKDLESQVKEIEKILANPNALEKAADKFKSMLDVMEFLSLPAEIAPRLAAYTVVKQGGFTKEQAAVFSGEITVNFNMRGSTKWVRQAYLFFNPAVQGSAKLMSLFGELGPDYKLQLKSKGFAYVAALIGVGAMANLFARAMSDDDEAGRNGLDKLPLYKRATSIVLWADGPSIPIPYGWNAFYALGHFAMDSALGVQPVTTTAKRIAQATFEAFSPLGSAGLDSNTLSGKIVKGIAPTAALPMVEWMLNENRFGAPIRREDSLFGGAKRPDSEMAFRSVSPISSSIFKGLNELTGGNRAKAGAVDVNPALFDHLVNSYLPGMINESYKAASVGARIASGEDVKSGALPIVDRFRAKVPESYDSGAFRRAKELIETKYQEFKEYPENRDEILKDSPGLRRAHAIVASATQEIRKLRSDLTAYENRKDVPDADKVARLNRVRERETMVYGRAVKAVMEAGPEFREAVMASD